MTARTRMPDMAKERRRGLGRGTRRSMGSTSEVAGESRTCVHVTFVILYQDSETVNSRDHQLVERRGRYRDRPPARCPRSPCGRSGAIPAGSTSWLRHPTSARLLQRFRRASDRAGHEPHWSLPTADGSIPTSLDVDRRRSIHRPLVHLATPIWLGLGPDGVPTDVECHLDGIGVLVLRPGSF